jgi:anti-sigma28 factor (negative regulator of flagellin synthesis)
LEEAAVVSTSTPTVPPPLRRASNPASPDTVEVSDAAWLRQRLRTEVGEVDSTPPERIAELRSQIAAGSFQPTPHAVAERLLADLTAELLA